MRRSSFKSSVTPLSVGLLVAWLSVTPELVAQDAPSAPRTPWGDPDIQGLWPSAAWRGVPLQRPESFGTRNILTDEEFAARRAEAGAVAESLALEFEPDRELGNSPPPYWLDLGTPQRQASLIVDPPDGRIPPITAEAEERAAALAARREGRGSADTWEDRSLYERCITRGVMNFLPTLYNNGNQILQSPGYVIIRHEMINETRIVPLDGRPRSSIRTHMGESRGSWDGDSLVVETTNYLPGTVVSRTPTSEDLRIVERFQRLDARTLNYQATVDDPRTWTRPWTVSFNITEDPSYPLVEYACHEGNYAMVNILRGARAEESGAAEQ